MNLFLDTCEIDEIRTVARWRLLDGRAEEGRKTKCTLIFDCHGNRRRPKNTAKVSANA